MVYDDVNKKWVPSGSSSGLSKVQLYHHQVHNTFRVVGRKLQDHEIVINCAILKGLKYNQATVTFHQWRDNKQVYGLNFSSKDDADAFARAMLQALDVLSNGSNISRTLAPSVGSTTQQQPVFQQQQQGNAQYDEDMGYRTMTREDVAIIQERRMSQQSQATGSPNAISPSCPLASQQQQQQPTSQQQQQPPQQTVQQSQPPPQQQQPPAPPLPQQQQLQAQQSQQQPLQQQQSGHHRTSSAPPAPQPQQSVMQPMQPLGAIGTGSGQLAGVGAPPAPPPQPPMPATIPPCPPAMMNFNTPVPPPPMMMNQYAQSPSAQTNLPNQSQAQSIYSSAQGGRGGGGSNVYGSVGSGGPQPPPMVPLTGPAAPPPPPPPPAPNANAMNLNPPMGGPGSTSSMSSNNSNTDPPPDANSLAAALQAARLKKKQSAQQSVENSGSSNNSSSSGSAGGSGNYGTLGRGGGGGMASMMDEMAKTLARRRAAVEKKQPEQPQESESSPDKKSWDKNNSSNNKFANGAESPKSVRKRFGSASEDTLLKVNGVNDGTVLTVQEMEAFKAEIIKEVRKEFQKMKQELVDGSEGVRDRRVSQDPRGSSKDTNEFVDVRRRKIVDRERQLAEPARRDVLRTTERRQACTRAKSRRREAEGSAVVLGAQGLTAVY
ncbi:Protein enabled [Dufourea novaeangliae]|uniref:Protein enabled n=1 Tax=Dufourea novaeangliae TaxID=178035 RepID=A0A154PIW5_DUFNO|nr:Protein enabled [Dufourea novaeangliae]